MSSLSCHPSYLPSDFPFLQVTLVFGIHLWMFFILPAVTERWSQTKSGLLNYSIHCRLLCVVLWELVKCGFNLIFSPSVCLGSSIRTLWLSSGTLSSVSTLACQPIRSAADTPLVSSATSSQRNTTTSTCFFSKGKDTNHICSSLCFSWIIIWNVWKFQSPKKSVLVAFELYILLLVLLKRWYRQTSIFNDRWGAPTWRDCLVCTAWYDSAHLG